LSNRLRLAGGLEHGVMSASAALIAYLPAHALGLPESFWGAITAIAVVQTEYGATRTTARDQFTGAAVGGLVGAAVAVTIGDDLAAYALAVVCAIMACWILNIVSAARLAGTTATIILLVPHQGSAEAIMLARITEVAWGVSVAIAVVWLITRLSRALAAPDHSG